MGRRLTNGEEWLRAKGTEQGRDREHTLALVDAGKAGPGPLGDMSVTVSLHAIFS